MRPDFSVSVSPSETNRNGVETRMAPANIARRTVARPASLVMVWSSVPAARLEEGQAAVEALAHQHDDEDEALQHQHGGIRQVPCGRCTSPPEAASPPRKIATGTITSGLWRARNDTRMPVKP